MKTGIIVAMDKEFTQLRTLLDGQQTERRNHKDFVTGRAGDNEIIMQQCGIGKVNSAVGTVEMIDNYHPDIIVSTGVAGGADASLEVTDVVVGTQYAYHDAYCGEECEYGQITGMPVRFSAARELVDKALATADGTRIRTGLVVSGDWFVDSREKMRSILGRFPEAVAVDMESCSIAQVCHSYKVPFVSFRVISDVPLNDDNAAQYFDFWARLAEKSFNVTRRFIYAL